LSYYNRPGKREKKKRKNRTGREKKEKGRKGSNSFSYSYSTAEKEGQERRKKKGKKESTWGRLLTPFFRLRHHDGEGRKLSGKKEKRGKTQKRWSNSELKEEIKEEESNLS